jgi:hypothetical protein
MAAPIGIEAGMGLPGGVPDERLAVEPEGGIP